MVGLIKNITSFLERLGLPLAWQKYLLILEIQACLSLLTIWWFYASSRSGLLIHLIFIVFVTIVLFTFIKIIKLNIKIKKIITIFFCSILQIILLTIYFIHYVGMEHTIPPFDLQMAWGYAGNILQLIESLNLSIKIITTVFFILILSIITSNIILFKKQKEINNAYGIFIALIILIIFYGFTKDFWKDREPLHIIIYKQNDMAPIGLLNFSGSRLEPKFRTLEGLQIKPRPIILITVDALRSDAMQVYGNTTPNTPFLSSLMKSGSLQRIENTKSICTYSYCALVGLLASRYWFQLNKTPDNLPDVLSMFGYKNYFLLGGDHTRFMNLKQQYGNNITLYKDGSQEPGEYQNDDKLIDKWLKTFNTDEPDKSFLYIHLMSVHDIGMKQPEYQVKVNDLKTDNQIKSDRLNHSKYINRYHNSILQVDDHIRKIFIWLNTNQWLEDAIVIITSDHGEFLGEFDKLGHGGLPYEPVISIPLLIFDKKSFAYPLRSISSQVDIAPTILHAINIPTPIDWSGIPLQVATKRCAVAINTSDSEGLVGDINGKLYKYLQIEKNNNQFQILDLSISEDKQVPSFDFAKYTELKKCFELK